MSEQAKLNLFAENLRQEVINNSAAWQDSDDAQGNSFREDEFTRLMIEYITESGDIDDGEVCYYRNRGMKVNGYSINADFNCLNLFVSIYNQTIPPETVPKLKVETAFKQLTTFFQKSINGYYKSVEEASDAFDMCLQIYESRQDINHVKIYLFTDGITKIDVKQNEVIDNIQYSFQVWDIERTYRCISSGKQRETIEVDFQTEYKSLIPCLPMPGSNPDYTTYMAIIPGELLYQVYAQYGSRLLERNVRSFLQTRGKVNKGIRETILKAPDRFLAYNNGISATAEAVELVDTKEGKAIKSIRDLQIVNGGQTTASMYQTVKKDRADLSNVFVQLKLSVIDSDRIDEIVPLISRYANSQNKVSEADFSANDPFHIRIEELSRTIWAPAVDGTQRQTRWFYERARGQYLDAQGRERTESQKKAFITAHPTSQKLTKTDLAKFENTWNQLPYLVSLGGEKNFREFTLQLAKRGKFQPDEEYFQRLIAKAILFRQTEKLVQSQQFGGYRANIVTYTLAYLTYKTAQRIDLDKIWREQLLSSGLRTAIVTVSYEIHKFITNPPGGKNITEWCKKEECWKKLQEIEIDLPSDFTKDLISIYKTKINHIDQGIESSDAEDSKLIVEISKITAETWFQISHWAKETNNLQPWQRGLAGSLGLLASRNKLPSRKQATQGMKILEEVSGLGFKV